MANRMPSINKLHKRQIPDNNHVPYHTNHSDLVSLLYLIRNDYLCILLHPKFTLQNFFMNNYIKRFNEIRINDVGIVGGKNSSLGEMFTQLTSKGIKVPDGFATTSSAFWEYLDNNKLRQPVYALIAQLDKKRFTNLQEIGKEARRLMMQAELPVGISDAILEAYKELCKGKEIEV